MIEAKVDGEFKTICQGSCIGHKRIESFESLQTQEVRLKITESEGVAAIRSFKLFNCE